MEFLGQRHTFLLAESYQIIQRLLDGLRHHIPLLLRQLFHICLSQHIWHT